MKASSFLLKGSQSVEVCLTLDLDSFPLCGVLEASRSLKVAVDCCIHLVRMDLSAVEELFFFFL